MKIRRLLMPENNVTNLNNMSDPAVVKEIGYRLKQMRLKKNITQDELAKTSGLNRATISQLENGRAATLLTLIQVLRAMNKLDLLNILFEEPGISPLEVVKMKKQTRERATRKKITGANGKESEW